MDKTTFLLARGPSSNHLYVIVLKQILSTKHLSSQPESKWSVFGEIHEQLRGKNHDNERLEFQNTSFPVAFKSQCAYVCIPKIVIIVVVVINIIIIVVIIIT